MEFILIPKTAKPANLVNCAKFIGNLSGRDKSLRFVQYFSRFLAYQIKLGDEKSDLGARLTLLYKGLSGQRKAMKVGAFLDEINKFKKTLEEAKDGLKKSLTLALRVFMFFFLIHDNLVWATALKVLKFESAPLKLRAAKLRLTAAFLNVAIVALTISETQEKLDKAGEDTKEKLQVKQSANFIAMLKNTCDVVTYSNSAKLVEKFLGAPNTDGTIGLLGAISALAGGHAVWMKM